jgi:hypothetical protein
MMRHDQLAFIQKHIANGHRFIQQSAGIAAHIQNQSIERWRIQLSQGIGNFTVGRLIKRAREANVANSRLNPECQVD